MSIHKYYKINEGKLIRLNPFCPRCGPGFFMAQNYDRLTCGHCGFTTFKKRVPKKESSEENKAKVPSKGDKAKVPSKGDKAKVPSKGDKAKVPSKGDKKKVPAKGKK